MRRFSPNIILRITKAVFLTIQILPQLNNDVFAIGQFGRWDCVGGGWDVV